jgi:hypothetical protein
MATTSIRFDNPSWLQVCGPFVGTPTGRLAADSYQVDQTLAVPPSLIAFEVSLKAGGAPSLRVFASDARASENAAITAKRVLETVGGLGADLDERSQVLVESGAGPESVVLATVCVPSKALGPSTDSAPSSVVAGSVAGLVPSVEVAVSSTTNGGSARLRATARFHIRSDLGVGGTASWTRLEWEPSTSSLGAPGAGGVPLWMIAGAVGMTTVVAVVVAVIAWRCGRRRGGSSSKTSSTTLCDAATREPGTTDTNEFSFGLTTAGVVAYTNDFSTKMREMDSLMPEDL